MTNRIGRFAEAAQRLLNPERKNACAEGPASASHARMARLWVPQVPRVLMPTRMCQGWHVRRRACRDACAHVHCSQTSHSARRVQRFCCSLRLALLQLDLDTHNVVLADLHGEPRRPADGSRRLLDRRRHECRRSGQAAEEEEEDGPHSKRGRGSYARSSDLERCVVRKEKKRNDGQNPNSNLSFGTPYRRLFSAFICTQSSHVRHTAVLLAPPEGVPREHQRQARRRTPCLAHAATAGTR